MPRLPIIRLAQARHEISPSSLKSYVPTLSFEGLQLGIDNLRHDVYLSATFVEAMRLHVARLIMRYGNVEALVAADGSQSLSRGGYLASSPVAKLGPGSSDKTLSRAEAAELKPLLTGLQVAALNRAKAEGNICLDLLVRSALIKFLRTELNSQFAQVLERCRVMLKSYEGVRQEKALEYRERVAAFQVGQEDHPTPSGAGPVPHAAGNREGDPAAHAALLFWKRAGGRIPVVLESLGAERRRPRSLPRCGTLRHAGQL
jgi:hypothetical protein